MVFSKISIPVKVPYGGPISGAHKRSAGPLNCIFETQYYLAMFLSCNLCVNEFSHFCLNPAISK